VIIKEDLLLISWLSQSRTIFLKALDCSNKIKDRDFTAKQIRDIIMEVGPSNVVQIATDNM